MDRPGTKRTAILAVLFAAVSLPVCLWRAATKPVTITGTVQAQEEAQEHLPEQDEDAFAETLSIEAIPQELTGEEDLIIPLPMGIRSENISTENNYLLHLLRITLYTDSDPYELTACSADPAKVRRGMAIRTDRDALCLRFELTGLFEPEMSLIDGTLHVRLHTPKSVFRHVVLVDPAERGNSTTDLSFRVAQALAARFSDDSATAVYLTRWGNEWDGERTVTLLEETEADLFLRLHNGSYTSDTDRAFSSGNGFTVCYNNNWFMRRYSNAQFARDLSVRIAGASGREISAILPAGSDDPLLASAEVPAACVYLGEYGDSARIAQGLAEALSDAFSILDDGEE